MGDLPLRIISISVARKRAEDIERRKTALTIFPEEVWRLVLKELDSPNDLWSASHASMQLADTLKTEKGTFFFSKISPLIFHHLDTQSIYNCHFVCKLWNSTIDETFLSQMPNPISPSTLEGPNNLLKLHYIAPINLAKDALPQTLNAPLFIEIHFNASQKTDQFFNTFKSLLLQFSRKVYNLRLLGCERYPSVGLYMVLIKTIEILLNIKILEIECSYDPNCRVNSLKMCIKLSSLPPLKNLVKMKLQFRNFPLEFIQEIFRTYGKQLIFLAVAIICKHGDVLDTRENYWFPNLEKLIIYVRNLSVLTSLLGCVWNSNKLKILSLITPEMCASGDEELNIEFEEALIKLRGRLKFFQVLSEDWRDRYMTVYIDPVMKTWIKCRKVGKDGRNIYYFVHAGPGFCI